MSSPNNGDLCRAAGICYVPPAQLHAPRRRGCFVSRVGWIYIALCLASAVIGATIAAAMP